MHHILGSILIGTILGSTTKNKLRPVLRKAVKGGLIVQREAQRFGRNIRAGADELVAEARADLGGDSIEPRAPAGRSRPSRKGPK